jgi:Domain of unknown function (DUF4340)
MNRGRNTLILLVLAAALGAYVYFVESKREAKPDTGAPPAETRSKVFDKLDSTKIDDITVHGSAGDTTHLKKTGATWQMVEPTTAAVDDTEVSGLVTNLGTVEADRVVDQDPKDLTKYGLAKPRIQIQFTADKTTHELQIGSKTATGGDLYAKVGGDKKVIMIAAYLESTFDRTPFQLRDKSILKFDRDKADSVEVVSGGTTLKFAKQGDNWKMTSPAIARTDSTAVDTMIGRLATGQMKALTSQDAPAADLAKYGLTKPAVEVTVGAGSARSGLLIGTTAENSTDFYAKDAARPLVFTIEKAIADDIKKTPGDFRTKDLFDARPFTVTHLDITGGGTTTVFEKKKVTEKDDKGKDQPPVDKWTQTSPAPPKPIDASKIEDVVNKITGLRADSFVDKLPAGAAELLTVNTKFDDGKKSEKVVIHKAGSDYYATRPDDAGAAKLTTSAVDDAIKALDAAR